MTDDPRAPGDENTPAAAGTNTDQDRYDYLIDPLTGLPEIDLPDEAELRIGRRPVAADEAQPEETVIYRAASSDSLFGYIVAMAVSFGLTPLLPDGAPMRYTIAWGLIALFGVVAWLLGNGDQIGQEPPENLFWGGFIGVLAGTPLYAFGSVTLGTASDILFHTVPPGALLAYLVFVMPLGETLFFRGILQQNRSIWLVGLLATAWNALLFFPLIETLSDVWAVAVFIATTLAIVNMVYGWVRERNGLAAAWVCQIVVNLMLIFLPTIS
jgi:membrane protease YdiL (CAAX protease family)